MKTFKKLLPFGFGLIGLGILVAYVGGAFSGEKVAPGTQPLKSVSLPSATVKVEKAVLPVWYDAVGTVRSVRRIAVSAQVRANIASIEKSAGDTVEAGEVIIRLDDAEFQSRLRQANEGVSAAEAGFLQAKQSLLAGAAQVRQMDAYRLQAIQTEVQTKSQLAQANAALEQARQAIASAEAKFDQAEAEFERVKKFKAEGAATQQQLEAVLSNYKQAKAGVGTAKQGVKASEAQVEQLAAAVEQARQGVTAAGAQVEQTRAGAEQAKEGVSAADAQVKRAKEGVTETRIALQYTTIKSPQDGVVVERLAEPGDQALPGKPLLIIHDPNQLRLEAYVPESLLDRVTPNSVLLVVIGALKLELDSTVDEVSPSGDSRSRTFLVKARLPSRAGLLPGMFGRLRLKQSERESVLVPQESIRRVGQMETVLVKTVSGWQDRLVRSGVRQAGKVEVLSGLQGDELLGLNSGGH